MSTRSSSRKIKSQRKAELRKKNQGLGIGKIDIEDADAPRSNKITFDDDFVAQDELIESNDSDSGHDGNGSAGSASDHDNDDNDEGSESDSDSEVEQVTSSAAKQQAMQMFAAERKTRKEESALSHKRKRKTKLEMKPSQSQSQAESKDVDKNTDHDNETDEEELDEDFFAMVDEERKEEAKNKKAKRKWDQQKKELKLNKHTTFVSEGDENITAPIGADHGIEVVVLPGLSHEDYDSEGGDESNKDKDGNNALKQMRERQKHALMLSTRLGTEPSSTALLFCRGGQAHARRESAEDEDDHRKGFGVKRSRKMKYGIKRGRPSSHFATRNKKR